MPASLGSTTKTRFHYGPEPAKLAIEFVVKAALTVHKGDPCILAADGTVQAAASVDPQYKIIGTALMDGIAGEFVTVVMRAYCVIEAEAAAAATDAGPLQLGVWNAVTLNREYAVLAGADDQVKSSKMVGHSLTPTVGDGGIIKVALL